MVVGARRAGLSISKTADILEFPRTAISRVYSVWMVRKKRKHPVSGSCVDENALLMSEVREEWAEWLEMTERQQ